MRKLNIVVDTLSKHNITKVSVEGFLDAHTVPEMEKISLESAKCLDLAVAGVDIVKSKGKYYVLEVNAEPGFSFFDKKGYEAVVKLIGKP